MADKNFTAFDPYLVLEQMNKGILLLKADEDKISDASHYQVVYANLLYRELFKIGDADLSQMDMSVLLPAKKECLKKIVKVMTTGEPVEIECLVAKLESWFSMTIFRPQEYYLAILFDDISKQRMAEEDLLASDEVMKIILDIAETGIWEWDMDGDVVRHNKKWASIMGFGEAELAHPIKGYFERVHPEDREQLQRAIDTMAENGNEFFSEHRMLLDDGRQIWVQDRGVVAQIGNRQGRYIIGSLLDVTNYRQVQEDLQLEKSALKATVLSVAEGIITTDPKGYVEIFNPAAEEMLGFSQAEVAGRLVSEFFQLVDPIKKCPIYDVVNGELKIIEKREKQEDRQALLITTTGKRLTIHHSVAPIRLLNGESKGFALVFSDISAIAKRQKQIEYQSFHDELTGLYNRYYMMDALARMDHSRNLPFTIMIFDLNDLKAINDKFGHAMGDLAIKSAVKSLRKHFRQNDILARIGGDEICALLPSTSAEAAKSIKDRIISSAPHFRKGEVSAIFSVGFAVKNEEGELMEDIIKAADQDMYENKKEWAASKS